MKSSGLTSFALLTFSVQNHFAHCSGTAAFVLRPFAVVDQDVGGETDAVDTEEAVEHHRLDGVLIAAPVEVEVVDVAVPQHVLLVDAVLLHAAPADLDFRLLQLLLVAAHEVPHRHEGLGPALPLQGDLELVLADQSLQRRPVLAVLHLAQFAEQARRAVIAPVRLRLAHVLIERDDTAAELETWFPHVVDEVVRQVARLGHERILLVMEIWRSAAHVAISGRARSILLPFGCVRGRPRFNALGD